MQIRYVGPHDQVEVLGRIVDRDGTIDVPADSDLVFQADWESVVHNSGGPKPVKES
jgi:hypothetical protein